MSEQELIVIERSQAITVFTTVGALDPLLAKIRAEIDAFVPDISTQKGRDAVASIAYKVAKSKSYLETVGKRLADEQKEIPKKIDASRKMVRDTLDAWKDEVRKPLTDWEAEQERRIEVHQNSLAVIRELGFSIDREGQPYRLSALQAALAKLESLPIDERCEEFLADYAKAKEQSLATLKLAISQLEKQEAEQAELARFRAAEAERAAKEAAEAAVKAQAEHEEKIRQEAAQKAQREAEAKAAAERQAEVDRTAKERADAEWRAQEQKLAVERAQLAAVESERRAAQAKIDAENAVKETEARIKREQEAAAQREAAELAKREASKRHSKKINNEAMADFIKGGLSEEAAKQAVIIIAMKQVRHVQINY